LRGRMNYAVDGFFASLRMTIQDFLDSLDANYFYVFLLIDFLDSF
jgi:hypothetical protein